MLNHTKYSDLTSEQYELIGKNFIEWSNIEFLFGILLSRLLFTPEFLGRTYSDQMGAVKLESAIKSALDIHRNRYGSRTLSEQLSDEISELLKSASKCRVLRNKLAHYLWMRSNDDEISGSRLSGKLPKENGKDESIQISVGELREYHELSHSIVERLQRLVIDDLPKIEEEQNLTNLDNRTRQSRAVAKGVSPYTGPIQCRK